MEKIGNYTFGIEENGEDMKRSIPEGEDLSASNERTEKFNKIEVGMTIMVKESDGNIAEYEVTDKDPNTLKISGMKKLEGTNSNYGGPVDIDTILDFHMSARE